MTALKDELGDLLLQVVFHARMAEETETFDFEDVAGVISDKMIRRHPHVFGEAKFGTVAAQSASWEAFKAEERAAKASADGGTPSALDGVTVGLPALARALKLQKRAARVGFDWPEAVQVFDKIDEELSEIKEEIESGSDPRRVEDEIGDLLFVVVNLARHLHVDPESALRHANGKFERRFRAMEQALAADDQPFDQRSLKDMEAAWQTVKKREG
jgi:MazG family protein